MNKRTFYFLGAIVGLVFTLVGVLSQDGALARSAGLGAVVFTFLWIAYSSDGKK